MSAKNADGAAICGKTIISLHFWMNAPENHWLSSTLKNRITLQAPVTVPTKPPPTILKRKTLHRTFIIPKVMPIKNVKAAKASHCQQ